MRISLRMSASSLSRGTVTRFKIDLSFLLRFRVLLGTNRLGYPVMDSVSFISGDACPLIVEGGTPGQTSGPDAEH